MEVKDTPTSGTQNSPRAQGPKSDRKPNTSGIEQLGPERRPRAGSQGSGGGGAGRRGAGRGCEPIKARPAGAERGDGARRRPGRARASARARRKRTRARVSSRGFAAGAHGPRGGAAGEGGARPHRQRPQHLQSAVAGRSVLACDPTPGRERGRAESAVSTRHRRGRLLCQHRVTCRVLTLAQQEQAAKIVTLKYCSFPTKNTGYLEAETNDQLVLG